MKKRFFWKKFAVGLLVNISLAFIISGCSLIKKEDPKPISVKISEQKQVNFDGNEQNGGVIDYSEEGFQITENAANRYTELTKIYGKDYLPQLKIGEGLVYKDGSIYMSNQYMVEFIVMNDKYRKLIK